MPECLLAVVVLPGNVWAGKTAVVVQHLCPAPQQPKPACSDHVEHAQACWKQSEVNIKVLEDTSFLLYVLILKSSMLLLQASRLMTCLI